MRSRGSAAAPLLLYLPPGLIALAMLVPLGYLVLRTLEADPTHLAELIWRGRSRVLLGNTLQLTGAVVAGTTAIALPLAWLVTRTDLPGTRMITTAAVLPLAVPGYVMAYALLGLGGQNGLAASLGVPLQRLSGLGGAAAALTLYAFPYTFLNLRSAFLSLDPGLEEAARSLGYSPWQVFLRVTLPLITPGLIAGALIVSIYTLGDFGAVALMRFEVFSFAIYTQYTSAFDRSYAAALALMLMALTALPLALEARVLKNSHLARVGSGVSRRPRQIPLGWKMPLALLFVAAVLASSVGLPALILLHWMRLQPPWAELPRVATAFGNSLSAAVPSALVAAAAALPLAYLRVRYPSRGSRAAERIAFTGYAVPPLALGLAMVFFSLRAVPALYQTRTLLILTYGLNFLALAMGPIRNSLMAAPRNLEEAARSLGRSRVAAFCLALFPLLRKGIFAALTLVFVMVMKELPLAVLLAPTGFTTLSTAVFSRTSEALLAEAAPYAAAIVLFSSLFVGLLVRSESPHNQEPSDASGKTTPREDLSRAPLSRETLPGNPL
ncbi:iron ABC transporter permease [Alkalispirochaeta sphaeroplastigenens]|uniref:Iron ABC transporter permease n=1 Tax=Alkalispirochaeta sphaeroplastigenens TaxID=1187066 RepID=A0A2S4JVR3_9SPIO|nr:iron ABC transporter permease [Alkalispirochaeta sphaeroplastigenens]POR03608.1 iron ABC transporter permease [Alkalispirochaeta sphaeroplastigenens]